MLENIHIQNFRCFENFKAEGFERINLIGGKNNSGKTCLLEGIFFGNAVELPAFVISELKNQRNALNDYNFYKNVVYKKKLELKIIIETQKDAEIHKIETKYPFENSKINFPNDEWNAGRTNLHFTIFSTQKNNNPGNFKIIKLYKELNEQKKNKICSLIQSILLTQIDEILIVDDIINIKSSELSLPIYYFGDALQNVFNHLVVLLSNMGGWKNKILLIDEIENGIHFSAHYDFWKAIFKLSKELNVQIFATTHSLEMIQQFNKVAKEEGEAAYFEMVRDENNKINAIKHSTAILEEELDLNIGIRGEVSKEKITITPELINTLNSAVKNAHEGLIANNIAVPFIKDGWIWETLADGTEKKLEKLEPLKAF